MDAYIMDDGCKYHGCCNCIVFPIGDEENVELKYMLMSYDDHSK